MARKKAAIQVDEAIASLSFGEAKERLQTILEDLEGHEVDIDDLLSLPTVALSIAQGRALIGEGRFDASVTFQIEAWVRALTLE